MGVSSMSMLNQIYYLVDEALPVVEYNRPAKAALAATLTPKQKALFNAYEDESTRIEDEDRQLLFCATLRLGASIAAGDSRTP